MNYMIIDLQYDSSVVMDFKFDSALVYALSCVGEPGFVLKVKQLEALKCLYAGSDAFLWVPTGYSKSICFQTVPFLFDVKLG